MKGTSAARRTHVYVFKAEHEDVFVSLNELADCTTLTAVGCSLLDKRVQVSPQVIATPALLEAVDMGERRARGVERRGRARFEGDMEHVGISAPAARKVLRKYGVNGLVVDQVVVFLVCVPDCQDVNFETK